MITNTIYEFRKELQNLGYSKYIYVNYPRMVQLFLEYTKETPKQITKKHIENYHSYLQERTNKKRRGTLTQSGILGHLQAIKTYFKYLQRTNQIKIDPYTLKIKRPQYQERKILTQEEIQKLYKKCKTQSEKVILHLCYGCGLRKSEAQNLNERDIDFEKKMLYVRKGKGKKRRVIPLTQKIATDLKTYIETKQIPTIRGFGQDKTPLLTNNQGNRMQGGTIHHNFKKLLKRTTDQADISLHNLRHSIATHLLENKMSIEKVRDFLGHSQLNTTQIYTRVNQF
jgi:integrase/recombinase XerD